MVPAPKSHLLGLLLLTPLALGQGEDPPVEVPPAVDLPPPVDQSGDTEAGQDDAWVFLLDRDAGVAFPARSIASAEAALRAADAGLTDERPGALVALGAAGAVKARSVLEGWASEGKGLDRLAAILALGELGAGLGQADLLLVDLLQHEEASVRECALLALLRSGQPGWRELATGLIGTPDHPLREDARALIAFVDDPRSATPPHPEAVRLLELRWLAARRHGTIGGRAWASTMLERLGRNERFLDEVVLGAATDVHMPGVKDHLLQLLLQPGTVARVRAAVRAMPRELDQLVGAGLWLPTRDAEWRAIFDEAIAGGVIPLLPAITERAAAERSVAPAAAALLVRRDERNEDTVLAALRGDETRACILACRGVGVSGMTRFVPHLRDLEEHRDPGVRGASLAARLMLADRTAREPVRAALTDRSEAGAPARARLRDALALAGRSGDLTAFLAGLAQELEGLERADLLAISAVRGRLVDGAELRAAFPQAEPGSPTALRLIEALALLPSPADLDFLADHFPLDEQPEINAALALALIRSGHKKVEPVLRAAVWHGPLDRSVLAAAIVKHAFGLRTLQHWVLKPPPEATSADIRRLGFAIGEWGGIEAIHELQERMGGVAGADRAALQGAFLGAMAARTH